MSIVKNTSIRDYWLSDLKLSYITDVFPRDRWSFHISNNSQNDNLGRTGKITPIIDGFKQFSKAVNPAYNISIDESIIPFKGRSDMKIIIKNKPNPEGFRMFVAACPRTGYVYNCLFDDRRDWVVDSPIYQNLTPCVIERLLIDISNLKSHAIVTDNYHTTLELLNMLKDKFIFRFVGTLRSNRNPEETDLQDIGNIKHYMKSSIFN